MFAVQCKSSREMGWHDSTLTDELGQYLYRVCQWKYRVARKKRPELSHGVMQQSRWNESAEKHVCNEQTSSNMCRPMNFHLNAET